MNRHHVTRSGKNGGAVFDRTGHYRYLLWRDLQSEDYVDGSGQAKGMLLFVMLNPNRADEGSNDPTIRRCIAFAVQWGYKRLEVVNLFAAKAATPRFLRSLAEPVGPGNDEFISLSASRASRIVVAWGNWGSLHGRDREVIGLLADNTQLFCFGYTKLGRPKHPLYLPSGGQPSLFHWPDGKLD